MARKSAASVKVKKSNNLMPLEDIVKLSREGYLVTLKTNIEVAKRIDNFCSIRDYALRFWDNDTKKCTPTYIKSLLDLNVETYKKIYDIAEKRYTLEEMSKTDMDNWYDEIIPKVENIKDNEDVLRSMIIFHAIQPYGERMLRDHMHIQEEIEKRKVTE